MHLDLWSSPFSLGTLCVRPNLCESSLQGSFFSVQISNIIYKRNFDIHNITQQQATTPWGQEFDKDNAILYWAILPKWIELHLSIV